MPRLEVIFNLKEIGYGNQSSDDGRSSTAQSRVD